jgi:hypothetical protein
MEDVLELYHEPYDPTKPVVCFDEMPHQMLSEVREPLPIEPGTPARQDYEYKREGTCNIFMFFQPLGGWREVKATEQRTAVDFAHCMKELVDVHFPNAEKIRVVLDQLNTHKLASLYKAFSPDEARRLIGKLDFRHTPKHGSWLNMAELELSVLSRQCLNRRLGTIDQIQAECSAWAEPRTEKKIKVDWRFSTQDARKKLQRLYPKL